MLKLARRIKYNFLCVVEETFYPYLLPNFYKLAGIIIAFVGLVLLCYNRMIPAKFQIPKESASIIFSMIMIFGLGLMAFSREKNESQKTREERKASLITGLLLAAAIWLIASFFSHGKINFVNFLWDFLFDDHNSVLDNTKLLIRFTLIFLVCKAFSFFIYMRTADTETDTEKPAMLKARPNNGESEEF